MSHRFPLAPFARSDSLSRRGDLRLCHSTPFFYENTEFVYQARSLISSVRHALTPCQVGIVCPTFKGRRLANLLDPPLFYRIVIGFNSRESNRYSTARLILIFLKSRCFGFNKKFTSLALRTLGTARATDFPARTHSSPICIVRKSGGSAFLPLQSKRRVPVLRRKRR